MKKRTRAVPLIAIVVLLILLAAPTIVSADGGDDEEEFTQTIDGIQVTLVFDAPPAIGENPIHIRLRDSQNQPIADARVKVSAIAREEIEEAEAEEDATEAEPEPGLSDGLFDLISTTLKPGEESGEYSGAIEVETEGEWLIAVRLKTQEEQVAAEFPVNIPHPKNGLIVLLSFLTVNLAVISAAALRKFKTQ